MREICTSGSEGGGADRLSLPLSHLPGCCMSYAAAAGTAALPATTLLHIHFLAVAQNYGHWARSPVPGISTIPTVSSVGNGQDKAGGLPRVKFLSGEQNSGIG